MPAMDTTSHPGHEIRRGHPLALRLSILEELSTCAILICTCFLCLIDLYCSSQLLDSTQRQMAIHIKEEPWWVKAKVKL